jgi:hypothetical protein
VSFEVDETNGTRHAENVVFEPDVAGKRARLRGHGRGVRH